MKVRSNRGLFGKRASGSKRSPELRYFIDVYWCDAAGTYLKGWAVLEGSELVTIDIRIGDTQVTAARNPRPDLLAFFPALAPSEADRAGFAAYLPGRPGPNVTLVGERGDGTHVSVEVELPDHQLPVLPAIPEDIAQMDSFPSGAPDGPILAIGVRAISADILAARISRLAGREVVGFDIHPGIGVDVVGDAHRLSEYFPPNHFAGIYSGSLIEHLTTPWLFAAECARVLMPGGRMFHQVPWAWPTHASPNDYWRVSPDALPLLFGPELGFRTIAVGTVGSGTLIPSPQDRSDLILMPSTPSALSSWIESEKVAEPSESVRWPYDAERGKRISAQYPVDGLSAL